jgi:hypothetical protein
MEEMLATHGQGDGAVAVSDLLGQCGDELGHLEQTVTWGRKPADYQKLTMWGSKI